MVNHGRKQPFPYNYLLVVYVVMCYVVYYIKFVVYVELDVRIYKIAYRCGKLNHIRCAECCYNAYCHYDWINFGTDYTEGFTHYGYDECKLTYLCHREAAVYTVLQRTASDKVAQCSEDCLPCYYTYRKNHYFHPVPYNNVWVDHHAYTDEEYGSKQILDGIDGTHYLICLDGFGQYTAHHECSECR